MTHPPSHVTLPKIDILLKAELECILSHFILHACMGMPKSYFLGHKVISLQIETSLVLIIYISDLLQVLKGWITMV